MRHFKLFIFLGLLCASVLHAQTSVKIIGTILDSTDHIPVHDAAVTVIGSHLGTYTDQHGRFIITDLYQGTYTLQISHIGYTTKTIVVEISEGLPVNQTILLPAKDYYLTPVLVEAGYSGNGHIELDASQIKASTKSNVAGLLSEVPEVYLATESSTGGAQIRIRGSNSNQVLVLLDGIPLNDPVTGNVDLSTIPIDLLKKISIHTRGASASAGSGAIGGVIRLETQTSLLNRFRINTGTGSSGRYHINGSVSGTLTNWQYSIFTEIRDEQNDYQYSYQLADDAKRQAQRKNAGFHLWSIHGSLTKEYSAGSFHLNGFVLQSRRGIPGRIYQWTPYASVSDLRTGVSAGYEHQLRQSMLSVDVGYSHSNSDQENNVPDDAPLQYRTVPSYQSGFQHYTARGDVRFSHPFTPYISVETEAGFQLNGFHQENAGTFVDIIDAYGEQFGPALGASFRIPIGATKYMVRVEPQIRYSVAAIRSSTDKIFYKNWSHSVELSVSRSGSLTGTIYAHTDRSFRVPTYSDLFYQDFRIEGNPGLRPEHGTGVSFGGRLSTTGKHKLSVQGEIFRESIDDNIIWVVGSFGNFTPTNTPSEITGQSIKLQWELQDKLLFGNIYFEHLRPLDKTPNHALYNHYLPFRPPYQFQLSVGTQIKMIEVTYHSQYRSKQYSNRANSHLLDAYQIGDLEMQWTGPVRIFSFLRFRFSASIENLWNVSYQTMERMPEPGRQYNLTVSIFNPKGAIQ